MSDDCAAARLPGKEAKFLTGQPAPPPAVPDGRWRPGQWHRGIESRLDRLCDHRGAELSMVYAHVGADAGW